MTGPDPTAPTADTVRHALYAAGATHARADDILEDLTANPDRAQAHLATAAELLAAGCPAVDLANLVTSNEITHAATLLAKGMSARDIWQTGDTDWLNYVVDAVENGGSPHVIARIVIDHGGSASTLAALYAEHMTDATALTLATRMPNCEHAPARSLLLYGATWDDITWALTANLPLGPISKHYCSVGRDEEPTLRLIPARVRMLAAILAAGTRADQNDASMLALLPAAAAVHDQPWVPTLLTLLADAQTASRPDPTLSYLPVLAARALEHGPSSTPATVTPWVLPPALAAVHPAVHPAGASHLAYSSLADGLQAGGIERETAKRIERELQPWPRLMYQLRGLAPARSPVRIPATTALTYAILNGASTTDLRALAEICDQHGKLGLGTAAIISICRVPLRVAAQWAAAGSDVSCATLLHAYGMSLEQAAAAAKDPSGWDQVAILGGGGTLEEARTALPAFANHDPGDLWDIHNPDAAGLPIPVPVLVAIADAGGRLNDIDEDLLSAGTAAGTLPVDVAVTAVTLTLKAGHRLDLTAAMLTYAAAAGNQEWAQHVNPYTMTTGTEAGNCLKLARMILTARGIEPARTETTRRVTRPAADTPSAREPRQATR